MRYSMSLITGIPHHIPLYHQTTSLNYLLIHIMQSRLIMDISQIPAGVVSLWYLGHCFLMTRILMLHISSRPFTGVHKPITGIRFLLSTVNSLSTDLGTIFMSHKEHQTTTLWSNWCWEISMQSMVFCSKINILHHSMSLRLDGTLPVSVKLTKPQTWIQPAQSLKLILE